MKWLLLILTSSLLFPCKILTDVSDTTKHSTPESEALKDLLITDCIEPCWLEIEIGSTSEDEAIQILERNELAYSSQLQGISVELIPSPLWENIDSPSATIWLEDQIVVGILVPVQVCVADLIEMFGTPLVAFSEDSLHYTLSFTELGATFSATKSDDYTDRLTLASMEITAANAHDSHSKAWSNEFEIQCEQR